MEYCVVYNEKFVCTSGGTAVPPPNRAKKRHGRIYILHTYIYICSTGIFFYKVWKLVVLIHFVSITQKYLSIQGRGVWRAEKGSY